MIKCYSNNIIVNYIKQLLHSFNLPTFKVLVDEEPVYLFEGKTYLYNDSIYVATNTTYVDSWDSSKISSNLKFREVYSENKNILNLTKNFVINNNVYDRYTHTYLGNYLRFVKDYKNLDLMSMYNCLFGSAVSNIKIVDEDDKVIIDTDNNDYRVYAVPVCFNKKYSIYIDCAYGVEIIAGFYSGDHQVREIKNNYSFNPIDFLYKNTYQKLASCRFSEPYEYTKLQELGDVLIASNTYTIKYLNNHFSNLLGSCEKDLCLFIKVPTSNDSSIVVLEGKTPNNDKGFQSTHYEYILADIQPTSETFDDGVYYIRTGAGTEESPYVYTLADTFVEGTTYYIRIIVSSMATVLRKTPEIMINCDYSKNLNEFDCYRSLSQLVFMNDNNIYPFSDRLVEYLTNNVITFLDPIEQNVERVEKNLLEKNVINSYTSNLFWTDDLRARIFASAQNKNLLDNKYDVLGYVDKDVEYTVVGKYISSGELEV